MAGIANLLLGISIEYLVFYLAKRKDYKNPERLNIIGMFLTGVVLFVISEHVLYITHGKECINL